MKSVLIVEDEPAYARLLHNKLASRYEVLDAHDGVMGLNMAIKRQPDLILLDIRMPKMDGLTVLQKIRKHPKSKSAKVILLTNLEANDKIIIQVTRDLPTYYFVKSDIDLDDLLDKIRDLLD